MYSSFSCWERDIAWLGLGIGLEPFPGLVPPWLGCLGISGLPGSYWVISLGVPERGLGISVHKGFMITAVLKPVDVSSWVCMDTLSK